MSNHAIDDILRAIHNAAIEAQKLTEQQHIRQISRYFDDEGKPLVQALTIPNIDPEDEDHETRINVPLLTLMPPTSIKIKEMLVEFEVGLNGFSNKKQKGFSTDKHKPGAETDHEEHAGPLNVDIKGGFLGFGGTKAKISIKLEGTDPPEALMRINDHLVKVIP